MSYLWWGYLLVGYMIALIFAAFFTKMSIIQPSKEKNPEIEIKSEKSFIILPLKFFKLLVIFANASDNISGYSKIFQLKHGWLFLLSGLFWPAFLVILIFNALGAIYEQLPPQD